METKAKSTPSLPANYVTLKQLQELRLKEKQGEEERRLRHLKEEEEAAAEAARRRTRNRGPKKLPPKPRVDRQQWAVAKAPPIPDSKKNPTTSAAFAGRDHSRNPPPCGADNGVPDLEAEHCPKESEKKWPKKNHRKNKKKGIADAAKEDDKAAILSHKVAGGSSPGDSIEAKLDAPVDRPISEGDREVRVSGGGGVERAVKIERRSSELRSNGGADESSVVEERPRSRAWRSNGMVVTRGGLRSPATANGGGMMWVRKASTA